MLLFGDDALCFVTTTRVLGRIFVMVQLYHSSRWTAYVEQYNAARGIKH